MTFSYAPYNLWPLAFICIATILFNIKPNETAKVKTSVIQGFLFGLGWFGAGISWVHVAIADFGGLPLVVSLILMLFLCAYLAIYPALAFGLSTKLYQKKRNNKSLTVGNSYLWFACLLPLFIIMEALRATMLTGFPWLSLGYILTDSPLNTLTPIIGEFGLSIIVLVISFCLFILIDKKHWQALAATSCILLILYSTAPYINKLKHTEHEVKVLLVQGNIQQSLKWDPDQAWPTMKKYQDLTRKNWDVDLVVWPEAAIPEIETYAYRFLSGLDSAAAFNNAALITGIVDYQRGTKAVFNNLIVVGKKEANSTTGQYEYLHTNRYTKHKLLPIGEFVPFEDFLRPLAPLFNLAMSSFTPGEPIQKNLLANGLHVLPANCFEIVFSNYLRNNQKENTDVLLTVSNDAWFGDSHGPHQHMQIARMRSQELGLPLLRVTNNGITAVYDPLNHQQESSQQFETNVLKTQFNTISGSTFYSKYGDTPLWIMLIILLISSFAVILKKS
ncbi:apolipoprotein N-acyltransferase [Pseudoalteromonas sp. NBT06-2]|uniref:apolipoprotein N-acyltransferase n=1 Tax=Pseudoalteromonas sp. NBT06-2 TaxID=2025950 RepID=UPI00336BE5F0